MRRRHLLVQIAGWLVVAISSIAAAPAPVTLRGTAPWRPLSVPDDWIVIGATVRNRQRRPVELNGVTIPGTSTRAVIIKLAQRNGLPGVYLRQHGGGPYHLVLWIDDAPPAHRYA